MHPRIRLAARVSFLGASLAILGAALPLVLDGTETLGDPVGITPPVGTDFLFAGVGLKDVQPGNIDIDVPANVAITQVLAYWEGHASDPAEQGLTDTVNIGGHAVTGDLIGGPTKWQTSASRYSATYRADITALGVVANGANSIAVSGLDFSLANNGLGLLVVVDDGSGDTAIALRDGNDTAFVNWKAPLDATVPVTYAFAPDAADRPATLGFFVASVALVRPSIIEISFDGVPAIHLNDVLGNINGPEWDSLETAFVVPAGASSVTVQLFSADSGVGQYAGNLPASMTWVASTFSLETELPPPPPPGDEGCTPGYWKNHLSAWGPTGYAPSDNFDQVFGVQAFGSKTMLQVAKQGGGGLNALGRQAVAALLSAAHPDVDYGMAEADVLNAVHDAIVGGDAGEIEALKDELDELNNAGCPL